MFRGTEKGAVEDIEEQGEKNKVYWRSNCLAAMRRGCQLLVEGLYIALKRERRTYTSGSAAGFAASA